MYLGFVYLFLCAVRFFSYNFPFAEANFRFLFYFFFRSNRAVSHLTALTVNRDRERGRDNLNLWLVYVSKNEYSICVEKRFPLVPSG